MTQELPAGWPAVSLARAHELLTAPGAPFEMAEAVIGGRKTRIWKNAPPTLRDVFVAGRAFGERIFLVHEDERVSFETFARASIALAHWLQAQGVKKGDRVAIVMRNLPEWPVAFWAGVLTGAIVTPLNGWWTGEELLIRPAGFRRAQDRHRRRRALGAHRTACRGLPGLERVYRHARPGGDRACPASRLEDVIGKPNDWASAARRAAARRGARSRRRRHDPLHLGHHGQTQGRDPDASQYRPARSSPRISRLRALPAARRADPAGPDPDPPARAAAGGAVLPRHRRACGLCPGAAAATRS